MTARTSAAAHNRVTARAVRAVALPSEHGGWSLTLEPVLLGLFVAWSWSGLALGAAAMLAFLARTPLKLVLVDTWRRRWLARTSVAAVVAVAELSLLGALVAVAFVGADGRFWLPPLAVAPLFALELWFDMRSRSRRLLPELAGTIAVGSAAAAIALAGGAGTALALGLWAVMAARAVASIPYARTQVFRARGKPTPIWPSDLAQAIAVLTVAVASMLDAVPLAAALVVSGLALFNTRAVRAAPRPAMIIGLQQLFFGLGVVVVTAISAPG